MTSIFKSKAPTVESPSTHSHDPESDSKIFFHPVLQKHVCHINFFKECDRYAETYKECMTKWYKDTNELTVATHCVRQWSNLERCMILQVRYGTLDVILDEEMLSQVEDAPIVEDLLDDEMKTDTYVLSNNNYFIMKYGYPYLDKGENH